MIPRHPQLRTCYRAAKFQRPKIKLHGAWCFGHTLQLIILEENQFSGSSMVQELLMITIEKVMAQCRANGTPCPDTLCVIGDNTVKELKNTVCASYMAALINHQKFKLAQHLL